MERPSEPAPDAALAEPAPDIAPAAVEPDGPTMFAADDLPPPATPRPVSPEPMEATVPPPPEIAPDVPEAPEADAAEAATPSVQAFTLGKRDPKEKARRLARVLVSDMIMYNPERHEKALAEGTLKEDFEEEIEKSWKEYVEQVGEEIAASDGQGFWSDALNDVLAKGQSIF